MRGQGVMADRDETKTKAAALRDDPALDIRKSWPVRSNPALAATRVIGLLGWMVTLLACSPIRAVRRIGFPRGIVEKWHRGSCKIVGINPSIHGTPVTDRPVLFVANHVSYLDISVLGATLDACFVAKSEVRSWPVFGYLAVLQRTVFVKRQARHAANQRNVLAERLQKGDSLILFPEGTSSDGNRALRFKSALFDAATVELDGRQVEVQPVSIAYTRFDGTPMGRTLRPFYAWYGDMDLAPHLWRALGMGTIGVDVVFHDPVRLNDFGSRKALARHCEEVVAEGLSAALSGRFAAQNKQQRWRYDGLDLAFGADSA